MVANLSEAQKKSIGDRKGNLSSVRQFLAVFKPFPDDGQELSAEALEALREWLQSAGLKEAKRVVEKMAKIGEDEDGYDDGVIAAGGTKKSDVRQALAGICGGYNSFLKLNANLINVIHQAKD